MAECIIGDDCSFKTDPSATYEDAHKVMQRHISTHIIYELRRIADSLAAERPAMKPLKKVNAETSQ